MASMVTVASMVRIVSINKINAIVTEIEYP